MMGCCGIFKPNRITQFCMGYSGLSDCKGMFPFKKNKRNTIDSKHSFSAVADLSFSRCIKVAEIVLDSNDSERIVTFALSNRNEP